MAAKSDIVPEAIRVDEPDPVALLGLLAEGLINLSLFIVVKNEENRHVLSIPNVRKEEERKKAKAEAEA